MARLKGWRRIANVIWSAPNDPQMYGAMDVDATAMQRYIERAREAGHRVTPTHMVGRAVALAIAQVPELNVRLLGLDSAPKETVDVFFLTSVKGGRDLSGVRVRSADHRTAIEVAIELATRAGQVRQGRDREFRRSKSLLNRYPRPLANLALRAASFLTERYNISVPALGINANAFGSAIVTNVGMFGIPMGFAPLAWTYTVPMLVLVGEICEKPVVVDHQLAIRPVLPLTATFDHRYADGAHIGKLVAVIREYLSEPERFEPALLPNRARSATTAGKPSYSSPPPAA